MDRSDTIRRLFGAAHFSKSIIWSSTDVLLLFLVQSNMRSDAVTAGGFVCLMIAYSCLLDLPIALLLTKFGEPRSQAIKLQAVAGPATGLALLGIFIGLVGSSGATIAIGVLVFRTAYAFLDVTHNALTTLLPEDAVDADRYVVTRSILSSVARLCIAVAGYWLITRQSDGSVLGFAVSALLAVLLTITTTPLVWVARREKVVDPVQSEFRISPRMALISLAAFLQSGPLSIASRLLPFSRTDIPPAVSGVSMAAFIIGSIIAPMLGTRLSLYVSWAALWLVSILAAALCGIVSMTVSDVLLSVSDALACGLANGILGYLIWSAASDEVRNASATSGRRRDLASFAALSTASKAAVGFSALLISPLLSGFVAGSASAANTLIAIELLGAGCLLATMGVVFHRRWHPSLVLV